MFASFGKERTLIYGLLDPGSTATICTRRLVEKLGLESKGWASLTINTMTGSSDTSGKVYDMTLQGFSMSQTWPVFDMVALDSLPISNDHITASSDLSSHPHLRHLQMPSAEVQHVDILIGQDNAHLLKPDKRVDGRRLRDPFAVMTPLGWTIYGLKQQPPAVSNKQVHVNYAAVMQDEIYPSLEEQVARSWELEKVPKADTLSVENRAVVNMWDANLCLQDGYIELPVPLKRANPDFPDNKHAVLARLRSLGKRLTKDPELHRQYHKAMLANFEKGYAVKCTTPPVPGLSWNLTKLPVVHKRKAGVVRPVWNGGFVFKGRSLNQEVHQGPDMTNRIVAVMQNFRLFPVAIMGEVKQMYNQVKVPVAQRDLMRFLYWEDGDPEKQVIDCCLTYHMFGGGWSPSVCSYALRKIIELAGLDPEGEVALTILHAFYVDDCVKSIVDAESGIKLITGITSALGQYHFDFTKLISNCKEVVDAFPEEKRADKAVDLDFDGGRVCIQHSLGQRWMPEDVFIFIALFESDPETRRELLSTLSSLYDPLGLSTPFLIPAKRLLQELSKRGLTWDDKLPEDVAKQWRKWVADSAIISKLRIPRWVGLTSKEQKFSLIHFCDASEIAYGAACYVCTHAEDGSFESARLLVSRCKLAPLKSQSIPRLELCAALLSAQLDESVRESLEVQPVESAFWSDSTLVLRYMNSEPSSFKTFVANRVSAIQEISHPAQWSHVPTLLNPADMLSRGVTAAELVESKMWLQGPSYLTQKRQQWPDQPDFLAIELPDDDHKRARAIYTLISRVTNTKAADRRIQVIQLSDTSLVVSLWTNCSTWRMLVTKLAWILYAVRRWRWKIEKKGPSPGELASVGDRKSATCLIIKVAQQLYLADKEVNSKTFQRLFPRLRDGMICIGGRIERATFPTEFKQPFVMPCGNRASYLFIMHCHDKLFHAGVERTLMEARTTAWLLTGKKGVSAVLKTCRICRRFKSKLLTQVMADLPPYRLKSGEQPFSYVGLDYLGPLQVKQGRSVIKRYICVILCSVSRAIHLEVAVDLSTSGFLNAFNRFVSRRGKPKRVLSDNGTNFVGASSVLKQETIFWNKEHVEQRLADHGIEWSFNPPSASHFGGMWERHNRTIRSLMLCAAEGHSMTDDGLNTLMCLIEQSINSRPLTRLSDDPLDLCLGNDGLVRAVDVRTADGLFTRPIAKLVLLEADLDVG